MKFPYYLLPFIALTITACKKEELPELPEENAPFYSIRGLVNEDSLNWVVGLDEATLSCGNASMNGIDTYYGQINSGSDGNAIRVEVVCPELIYDGATIGAIKSGKAKYLVHQPGSVKLNFGMYYSQFNYVLVKNESNDFVSSNEIVFDEYGLHNVVLKFTDYSSTESFNLPIRYGFEYTSSKPGFHSSSDGDTLVVTPETMEGSHKWYVNGTLQSNEPIFKTELADGIYQVSHRRKDPNGNEAEHTTLIRMKDGEYLWQLKYFYLGQDEPLSNFGTVMVSMRKDGVWYKSEYTPSNICKTFDISNIKTIIDTKLLSATTLFDFNFGTSLLNENQTDSLSLPQMTGTLSVGLK